MSFGSFMRYAADTEDNRAIVAAEPRLRPVLFRATREEASAAAKEWARTFAEAMGVEPKWIHHPGGADSADPFERFGSWGWKTE